MRPEKNVVDYFPHYIGNGKKMMYIERKFGNDGYATWFKILEKLASTDHHFLDINDPIELSFLAEKCNLENERFLLICDELAALNQIDKQLWEVGIIWSQKFVDSVADAYKRRRVSIMDKKSLCMHIANINLVNADIMHTITELMYTETPLNRSLCIQKYTKEKKENKRKVEGEEKEENPTPPPAPIFDKKITDLHQIRKVEELGEILKSPKYQSWRELFCMQTAIDMPDLESQIDKFVIFLRVEKNETAKSEKDFQNHFVNWMKKVRAKVVDSQSGTSKKTYADENKKPTEPGDWRWNKKTSEWIRYDKLSTYLKKSFDSQAQ